MYKVTMTEKNSDWSFSVNNLRSYGDVIEEVKSLRNSYRNHLANLTFTIYENGELYYRFPAEVAL